MCDEMCGMKGSSNGDTWWWNKEVNDAISRKKDAHKAMCYNSTDENKKTYKCMKIKQRKQFQKQ